MTLLLVLAVFCLAGAAFLLGELVTLPARQRFLSVRRAATYGRMEIPSGTPDEGVKERVITPISEWLSRWALRVNPRSSTDVVRQRLMAAGLGLRITPTAFLAVKGFLALGGIFLGSLIGSGKGFGGVLMGAMLVGALGFLGPDYALTLKARGRKEKVKADLPDALDLLAVSVEAGLGFDASLAKINEHMEGPLAEEFGLTLSEMRIGEGRQDALKRLVGPRRRPGALGVHARHHPGRPARDFPRPDPSRAGGGRAPSPPGGRRGEGDEGADQDALPDRALHLPGHVPRHPRAGDPQRPEALRLGASDGPR